jgi:hypothetical protein
MMDSKIPSRIIQTVYYIDEIRETLRKADQDTLVTFDIDGVILAARDLILRPKATDIREAIFREYEQKYDEDRIQHMYALLYARVTEQLVETKIIEIINELRVNQIPNIAYTTMSRRKYIKFPMAFRLSLLRQKCISFSFEGVDKTFLWGNEAGYKSGLLFSVHHPKGEALQHFLENIVHWKPKHIIHVDDKMKNHNSILEKCGELRIQYTGFDYQAASLSQDRDLSPEIARSQMKILDEEGIWVQVF